MINIITFIILVVNFMVSHIIFEKNMVKIKSKFSKVLFIILGIEILLVILAAHINFMFPIMIQGTIMCASFINVYFRKNEKKIMG